MSEVSGATQNADHGKKEETKKVDDVKMEDTPTKDDKNDSTIAEESSIVESSINAEKSEDADAGDDEDSGSDSDESLPPGLLERPVEILENKRARKKITRFTYDDEKPTPSVDKKNVEVPKGIGIPLGKHPRVEYQLQRNTAEDLKIIHKFFYGVPGATYTVKKNIREFCGFVMDKDSPQYEKKEEVIGKFTVDNLKWAMTVCDVSAKGKKEDLIDAFMEWCLCPKPQDKPVPGKKEKKTSADSGKKKIKVKRSKKKMANGGNTSDTSTPVKRVKKAKKRSTEKKAKIRISSPKSKSKLGDSSADSSDDEPLVQKKKTPPTNGEVRKYVESLLKGADLEVMTMKVVFQQVYEHYPEFDLTDRKSFIKETVKNIIS